jgi:predicted amidohydrolase
MANRATISTIGVVLSTANLEADDQGIVDEVIEFSKINVGKVLPDKPDIIVVPECYDRPGNMPEERRDAYYRTRGTQVRDYFAQVARENNCYVAYANVRHVKQDDTWRNSIEMIDRQGESLGYYNKNHIVIGESDHGILCGKDAPIFECDFGRVGCAICFDLNFDELRLKYVAAKPDLLIFSSMYHGGVMQPYWAYSCRSHFVSALNPSVPSAIIAPNTRTLAETTNYIHHITATVNLDCVLCHLDYNWAKLDAAKAKYGRGITIDDTGRLASVLLTSEMDDISVKDIVAEFGMELLDDYMARALAHHHRPENIEP